jgi:hypothetical protein
LVICHGCLNLSESILTYVYKGLKELVGDITFVSAGLFTPKYTTAGLQCCQLLAEVFGHPVEKSSLILLFLLSLSS